MTSSPRPVENPTKSPAKIANTINKQMERLMPVLTPLGIVAGFLLPGVFIHLRPYITLLFSILTFSGALKLGVREFGRSFRSPMTLLLVFVSGHIVSPLAARAAAALFLGGDLDTTAGFILLYAGPTAVSGFIWTAMFRGDSAFSLTLILLDTILAPLVVPATMFFLSGTAVHINFSGIAISLFFMVVAPTIAGVAANEISRGKAPALLCPYLAPFSKICLVLIIAANTSPVARSVRLSDPKVWSIAAMCVSLAAINYCLARLTGIIGRLSPEKQVSLFFAGGLRNISAITTIAVDFFAETAVLPALLGIVFQQSMAAIMGRALMGKRLKKSETRPDEQRNSDTDK